MIKLFWNTHNQIKLSPAEENTENARNYKWGLYHKKNSDKWIFNILDKINYHQIETEKDLQKDDILIIVDSSIEKKSDFYSKLKLTCSRVFLIHLGDEFGLHNISSIYDNCDYIWRAFCSNKYFDNKKVSCVPIGYKSGTHYVKQKNSIKYKWSFVGTPHKSSRHDLLFQLTDIKPSFFYKTEQFDKKIIEVNEMSKIFSSTDFIPCPNGFVHPETYRLYEALECGCIPIVEKTYEYYDRLFPQNPFLKVKKWSEAKNIIKTWNLEKVQEKKQECILWWSNYKNELQNNIKNKISL